MFLARLYFSPLPAKSLFLSRNFCPNGSFVFPPNASGLAGPRWDCACQWLPVGVDNKRAEESAVITSPPARPPSKKKKKKLTPSEDRNGMSSVPAELSVPWAHFLKVWVWSRVGHCIRRRAHVLCLWPLGPLGLHYVWNCTVTSRT